MATQRKSPDGRKPRRRQAPATTLEGREQQLAALAYDLAEEQMLDGTVSAQVQSHFLKLGSSREKKEQRRMELDAELAMKKIEQIDSIQRVEELYDAAINAMRSYTGGADTGTEGGER